MVSIKQVEVTYADTDAMGVVYHANYIVWFELGRSKFFNDAGFSLKECMDKGLIFPVVSVKIDYFTPTKYLDDVEVHTSVKNVSKVATTYLHKVYANGVLSVIGEVKLAHVDADSFKPVNLKKRFEEVYMKYTEEFVNGED